MTRKQGHDPVRTFRAGDEYAEAQRIAGALGHNLSEDVLRPALRRYITKNRKAVSENDD